MTSFLELWPNIFNQNTKYFVVELPLTTKWLGIAIIPTKDIYQKFIIIFKFTLHRKQKVKVWPFFQIQEEWLLLMTIAKSLNQTKNEITHKKQEQTKHRIIQGVQI